MLPDVDDMPVHQILEVLAKTKMPIASKNLVVKFQREFRATGALSRTRLREIKLIFRRHKRKIDSDELARDRARESMARERSGSTLRGLKAKRRARLVALQKETEDFGI